MQNLEAGNTENPTYIPSRFVFYFPYRGFGGVPILFLRVAEQLVHQGYSCSVVDFTDGYMAKNLKPGMTLIPFSEAEIQIPENSLIILQSDLPWGIPRQLKTDSQTRVFFWNCYPFNLIPVLPEPFREFVSSKLWLTKFMLATLLRQPRNQSVAFLKLMLQKEALVFMDETNLKTSEYALSFKPIAEKYLPVFVSQTSTYQAQELIDAKKITLGWVGRIADFKYHSLTRVIEDFAKCDLKIKKHFIIVGTGQHLQKLKTFCKLFSNIQFEFIDSIPAIEVAGFINQKVDVLCAMGMSALEGGLAKVPTVLLDFSYSPIPAGYQYTFLNNTYGFNVGRPVNSEMIGPQNNLQTLLDSVLENKKMYGEKCYDYVIHNHSAAEKAGYFLRLSQKSSLTYQHLIAQPFVEKPWFYRLREQLLKLIKARR